MVDEDCSCSRVGVDFEVGFIACARVYLKPVVCGCDFDLGLKSAVGLAGCYFMCVDARRSMSSEYFKKIVVSGLFDFLLQRVEESLKRFFLGHGFSPPCALICFQQGG